MAWVRVPASAHLLFCISTHRATSSSQTVALEGSAKFSWPPAPLVSTSAAAVVCRLPQATTAQTAEACTMRVPLGTIPRRQAAVPALFVTVAGRVPVRAVVRPMATVLPATMPIAPLCAKRAFLDRIRWEGRL
jgi:hypothetical protein